MMVLEAQTWANNSDLIRAVFDMHVFPKRWARRPVIHVLDVTYGRGKWWDWNLGGYGERPEVAVESNRHGDPDWFDFRHNPHPTDSFDVVAFDPDYVAPGGRKTSTIGDFNDRYGLKGQYETPAALQAANDAGLTECCRVLKPQGLLLAKTMNYISSGRLVLGEHNTIRCGLDAGMVVEDIFVHVGGTGPQPAHARQMHARSNSSRLVIFRKPGRRGTN
jgi:hypothetical protein